MAKTSKRSIIPYLLTFLGVLMVFLFVRLFNITQRIQFDWDQERDAFVIYDLFTKFKPTLIGPRVFGPEGFFLGPYFTYLIAPFYLLTGLHPYAIVLFVATYNIVFFSASYMIIKKLFNRVSAVIFLLLWGTNEMLVRYDISAWNPLLIPLGVLLLWYLLKKIFIKPNLTNHLLLGLLTGLFFHFHFQFIFLFLANIYTVFCVNKKRKTLLRNGLIYLSGFGATFMPLVLFDLKHGFLNSQLFIRFFFQSSDPKNYFPDVWLPVVHNLFKPLTYSLPTSLFLAILIGGLWWLAQRSKKDTFPRHFYIYNLVLIALAIFGFTIYGKRPSEYYFVFLYPITYLTLVTILLTTNRTKYILALMVSVLIILNGKHLLQMLKEPNSRSLYFKNKDIHTDHIFNDFKY